MMWYQKINQYIRRQLTFRRHRHKNVEQRVKIQIGYGRFASTCREPWGGSRAQSWKLFVDKSIANSKWLIVVCIYTKEHNFRRYCFCTIPKTVKWQGLPRTTQTLAFFDRIQMMVISFEEIWSWTAYGNCPRLTCL